MDRVRKGRDIDAALCKKGFRRDTDGKHVQYFFVGFSEIRTMMSHGDMGATIGANLIAQMARQLRLTKAQFLALIDCSLSEEGYRTILKDQGFGV